MRADGEISENFHAYGTVNDNTTSWVNKRWHPRSSEDRDDVLPYKFRDFWINHEIKLAPHENYPP